jgi:protein arginine N-methyltransferase 1
MLQHYRQLIDDPVRLGAFQRAIGAVVRPGDVVADVGCGLGTYALFAARAGARRVFAVDDSPIVEVAREVVRANRCEDTVEIVAGYSTAVTPPEPCDVVLFEDYSATLVSPHQARVVHDLIRRWLKPGGQLLPSRARLWLAPVEDPEGHLAIDRFHWTQDRVYGIDFSPTRRRVFATPHPAKLGAGALLTAPERARDYDLLHLRGVELSATRTLAATRDGVIHGLLIWWELELTGTWLGTGPLAPPSAWQQMLFPLATPLPVTAGAPIEVALQAAPLHDLLLWRWTVGTAGRRVDANSAEGEPLPASAVALARPEHVPPALAELEIDRAVLDAVDGRRSLIEIARLVRARFDGRFDDEDAAARRVAQVLARYS